MTSSPSNGNGNPPPSYDHLLLERLNKLKGPGKDSGISLDISTGIGEGMQGKQGNDALSVRLKKLREGVVDEGVGSSSIVRMPQAKDSRSSTPNQQASGNSDQTQPAGDEDKSLETLLAELHMGKNEFGDEEGGSDWMDELKLAGLGGGEEGGEIGRLLDEARRALPGENRGGEKDGNVSNGSKKEGKDEKKNPEQYLTRDLDLSVFAVDDDEEDEDGDESVNGEVEGNSERKVAGDDSEEVKRIVEGIIDEVEWEKMNIPETDQDDEQDQEDDAETANPSPAPSLNFPSVPSTLSTPNSPLPSTQTHTESSISLRLAALKNPKPASLFPSAPTTPPLFPSVPTTKPKELFDGFKAEEIDKWCVICQDDAVLLCEGCGGDFYCRGCWDEGHRGEGVGFEERGHRWRLVGR